MHTNNQKKIIEEIYKRNWTISNPDQANMQANLLDTVSDDIYPDPKRFLAELIQNCDDSSFSHDTFNLDLTFTILNNTIIVSHQGKPFDESDIH